MISSLVASFASLVGYTPFVFNQTMADGYWQNYNNGRVLHSLEGVAAAEVPHWHRQQWRLESNPITFYANAIFVLYLLWAARGIYRHMRATPAQPLEREMNWTGLVLFLGGAARFACGWLLNLYYEGTLQGSRQDLIVPSQENKMHHSLLILYLPLLGLGFQWAMRHQEAEERKARHLPEPAPQPAFDGWRTELATLGRLVAYGFGFLLAFGAACHGFRWLETAPPAIGSPIILSPFLGALFWACKDDILAITAAQIRGWLFTAYRVGLWFVALWSMRNSLWLYVVAFSLIVYHAMPAKPKTA